MTGLTPLAVFAATASPDDLRKWLGQADRVAAKHGVPVEWVRWYLGWRV